MIPSRLNQHQHRHYPPLYTNNTLLFLLFFASFLLPSFPSPFSSSFFSFCRWSSVCLSVVTVQFLFCISTLGVGLIGVLSNHYYYFNIYYIFNIPPFYY